MAATLITPSVCGPFGAVGTLATATPDTVNGNCYSNPGGQPCVLVVTNGSGSAVTLTWTYPATPYNGAGALSSTAVSIPASGTRYFCVEPSLFNNASGQAQFLMSSSATVTLAVLQIIRSLP